MSYPKETKDFYFFQPAKPDRTLDDENLYLVGDWSRQLEDAIRESGVSDIIVKHWGGKDLNFLGKFASQIRQLWIQERVEDISVVNKFQNLEDLSLGAHADQVDFSRLLKLRECSMTARDTLGNLGACQNLEELTLVGARIKDLTNLSTLKVLRRLDLQETALESLDGVEGITRLEDLFLRQVGLGSLDGIQRATKLCFLMLVQMRRLTSVSALTDLKSLTNLDIDGCRKVKYLGAVGRISFVQKLNLGNLGEVPSLSFVANLRRLEELSFWDSTNIVDGKLGILLKVPGLKKVGFKNRKHYSHTMDQINRLLESKYDGNQ